MVFLLKEIFCFPAFYSAGLFQRNKFDTECQDFYPAKGKKLSTSHTIPYTFHRMKQTFQTKELNPVTENGHFSSFLQTLQRRPDALAELRGSEAFPGIRGTARFFQTARGVLAAVEVLGLPGNGGGCDGRFFAFHIHAGGACTGSESDPFSNALAHYNPSVCLHPAHAGDLPPLLGNHGYAFQICLTDRIAVSELLGRTVIVHAGPDDFTTQPAGNAGARIACGVIRRTGSWAE